MAKQVLIGTVTLEKDIEMINGQFGYAANFERLLVPKGEYPIYAYSDDLATRNGRKYLGWRNYVGYEGTVITGNVGGKPGEHTRYHQMSYEYILAEHFLNGNEYIENVRAEYALRPEWEIVIHDFVYDGKRNFTLGIALKDGAEMTYME